MLYSKNRNFLSRMKPLTLIFWIAVIVTLLGIVLYLNWLITVGLFVLMIYIVYVIVWYNQNK